MKLRIRWLVALGLGICGSVPGLAQTLTANPISQNASPGQTVASSLLLASQGQGIAALQFDLQWDPALTVEVAAGDQLRPGLKILFTNPLPPAGIRCLIAGANQASLADGELLKLYISSGPTASLGAAQVRIVNVTAVASDSSLVSVSAAPVSVLLQNAGGTVPFPASAILNAASWLPGPIAPGEIISLVGGLGIGSTVLIDGVAAPILFAGPDQVNAVVPFGLDLTQNANIQIVSPSGIFAPVSAPVASASPAIFTLGSAGFGPGAILNQDYSVNSAGNPALPGSVIMIYGTGFGALTPPGADGQLAPGAVNTALGVTASIAGVPASVFYAGAAPGIVYGLMQINVAIPAGLAGNLATPVALTIAGVSAPPGVTVAIQGQ